MGHRKRCLIAAMAGDDHSFAVASQLERWGHKVDILFSETYPTRANLSFAVDGASPISTLYCGDAEVDLTHHEVVWWRRYTGFRPSTKVHPDDWAFVEAENRVFAQMFIDLVSPGAFFVNPRLGDLRAANKVLSLQLAKRHGLQTPRTMVTNRRSDAVEFIQSLEASGTTVVHKSMLPHHWTEVSGSGSGERMGQTTRITVERLVDEQSFRACPSILQEEIATHTAVRATFMGQSCCAIGYRSPDDRDSPIDSRLAMARRSECSRHSLPEAIKSRCVTLMQALGLVFGCFDFIVDRLGNYIFLEVNPQGQFLWMEKSCHEVALLEAFCEFLVSGDVAESKFARTANSPLWQDVTQWDEYVRIETTEAVGST